jgi:hypothetical protein
MILSTRESPAMRDALLAVGMSQVGHRREALGVSGRRRPRLRPFPHIPLAPLTPTLPSPARPR